MNPPGTPGRPHVTVVGDVGLDVLAKLDGELVRGEETSARLTATPGGAGGNTAAWLAVQDVDVTLIARVGDDEAGRTALAGLSAAGIDCRFAVDPQLATCCVVVLVAADGDRTMLSDRGANAALRPGDLRLPVARGPGHLHLSGYVLLDEASRPAGLVALAAATAAGWTTSVDPQSATGLAAVGARSFLSMIAGTDLLLPNESELAALGGPDAALEFVGAVAVTLGRRGAAWYARHSPGAPSTAGPITTEPMTTATITAESMTASPITVQAPELYDVDSTGAGDAFNAGVLAAWLRGADPATALLAGVGAGSSAASQVGGRPSGQPVRYPAADPAGPASVTSGSLSTISRPPGASARS